MARMWDITVLEKQQQLFHEQIAGALEIGRQKNSEEVLHSLQLERTGRQRLVIARLDEINVSRSHAVLEPLDNCRLRLRNMSASQPITFADGKPLGPQECCELALPAALQIGRKVVRIQETPEPADAEIKCLEPVGSSFHADMGMTANFATIALGAHHSVEMESFIGWLKTAMGVLQSAASSMDFFDKAARALVDMVGMDSGHVLLLQGGDWRTVAQHANDKVKEGGRKTASRQILQRLLQEKRTFWQVPRNTFDDGSSLVGIKAVVAAPILGGSGEVLGALYADRHRGVQSKSPQIISKVEAMLVELLASSVATGLARLEQEQAALRARVQFEQFFTPELSRQLQVQPDLLEGRDAEVSLLFCDIRGFSRVSERLGPARTLSWVNHVMGELSECVLAYQGVLVDYIGDELMAMWGAPGVQADHAKLACRSALAMLASLPKLNEHWQPVLEEPMDLGIGINTGSARVGNTGTQRKFKYGPLGSTVNLASRVQGATKFLKTQLLITEATHAQLDDQFAQRRLSKVRVVNIKEPVDLYELVQPGNPDWNNLKVQYEDALGHFEKGNNPQAVAILGNLVTQHFNDGPTRVLLARVVEALGDETGGRDTVWELPGK